MFRENPKVAVSYFLAFQYPLLICFDIFPGFMLISHCQIFAQRTHFKIGLLVFQLQKLKRLHKRRNSHFPKRKFLFEAQLRGFNDGAKQAQRVEVRELLVVFNQVQVLAVGEGIELLADLHNNALVVGSRA